MKTKFLKSLVKTFVAAILLITTSYSFGQDNKTKVKSEKGTAPMSMKEGAPIDTATIERVMGVKGKSNKGEYKITIPQNDLNVTVDEFKIIPAMGLSTWV